MSTETVSTLNLLNRTAKISVIFCRSCCMVKRHGEWGKMTPEWKTELAQNIGRWEASFELCPGCQEKQTAVKLPK